MDGKIKSAQMSKALALPHQKLKAGQRQEKVDPLTASAKIITITIVFVDRPKFLCVHPPLRK